MQLCPINNVLSDWLVSHGPKYLPGTLHANMVVTLLWVQSCMVAVPPSPRMLLTLTYYSAEKVGSLYTVHGDIWGSLGSVPSLSNSTHIALPISLCCLLWRDWHILELFWVISPVPDKCTRFTPTSKAIWNFGWVFLLRRPYFSLKKS